MQTTFCREWSISGDRRVYTDLLKKGARMWRVVLLAVAFCCVAASGKSIFDENWDDSSSKKPTTPKKTYQPPPDVRVRPPEPAPEPVQPVKPDQPAPEPAQPAAPQPPVTPPPPARAPMLSDAALAPARKLVAEAYGDKLAAAKTPDKKIAIARTLLEAASSEKDLTARCALLVMARDLASDAGDYAAAADAIQEIENSFVVDGLKMNVDALAAAAKTAHAGEPRKQLMNATSQVIDKALSADRYDIAKAAVDAGAVACRSSADADLLKLAADNSRRVKAAEDNFANVKLATAILKQKPADPNANLTVGRYLCVIKGDWDAGLPMLAKSGDLTLSTLAQQETRAADGKSRLMLADGWWDLGSKEQGLEKKQFQTRAVLWYSQAAPDLTGLEKIKAEQRVSSITAIKAIIKEPGGKDAVATAKPSGDRPAEIVQAIANRTLIEGMTFREACRAARLPFKMISKADSQTVYRWTIKGRLGTHQVAHRSFRGGVTYETVADYGTIGYVEGIFVNDSLTEFKRIRN